MDLMSRRSLLGAFADFIGYFDAEVVTCRMGTTISNGSEFSSWASNIFTSELEDCDLAFFINVTNFDSKRAYGLTFVVSMKINNIVRYVGIRINSAKTSIETFNYTANYDCKASENDLCEIIKLKRR